MKIDIFSPETAGKYTVIYADPPWSYAQGGRGAATNHYPTMTPKVIKELPVEQLAAKDAVLLMWATFPNLPQALETIEAWGFKYKTLGFNWIKKNRGGVAVLGIRILDTQQPGNLFACNKRKTPTHKRFSSQRDRGADTTAQQKAGRNQRKNCAADGRRAAHRIIRPPDRRWLGLLGQRSMTGVNT